MATSEWRDIARNSLWAQNAGLVQILGMCPVLVMSNSIVNAVSLGLATSLVMLLTGLVVSAVRPWVPHELRTPIFVLIIAALVTLVDLALNAWVHPLYVVLGIFIPLITTNCIVLARAEAYASRNGVWQSGLDGLLMGLGLTWVLALLGGLRELAGQGTLLSGLELVFGPSAARFTLHIVPASWDYHFLLMLLPPGAFFGLGLLIAGKNALDARKTTPGIAPDIRKF